MKYHNQTDGIGEAIAGFNRMNKTLAENWTDTNMQSFNALHLLPIANNCLRAKQETEGHLELIDKTIQQLQEQEYAINEAISRSQEDFDSELEGCHVCHCYVHDRIGNSCMKGFLIPREQAAYANDEDLQYSLACSKLPEYDDPHDFLLNERISLHR